MNFTREELDKMLKAFPYVCLNDSLVISLLLADLLTFHKVLERLQDVQAEIRNLIGENTP